jgi:hypothetical protein
MSTIHHFHACQDCGAKTPCTGTLADNFDGEPPIICEEFHRMDGTLNPAFICERCEYLREDQANANAERIVG